jgi:hypothetical protein
MADFTPYQQKIIKRYYASTTFASRTIPPSWPRSSRNSKARVEARFLDIHDEPGT